VFASIVLAAHEQVIFGEGEMYEQLIFDVRAMRGQVLPRCWLQVISSYGCLRPCSCPLLKIAHLEVGPEYAPPICHECCSRTCLWCVHRGPRVWRILLRSLESRATLLRERGNVRVPAAP